MYEIPISISPSRTYMIGVYDPVCPNKIHFEKVILPEAAQNTINSAKQHYFLANMEDAETIRIVICISIEEYLSAAHTITEDEKENNISAKQIEFDKRLTELKQMGKEDTRLMEQIELMANFNKKLLEIKRIAWQILQIE